MRPPPVLAMLFVLLCASMVHLAPSHPGRVDTPTPTPTPTATPPATATPTATATATRTSTPSPTQAAATSTPAPPTVTATSPPATATRTRTPTPTPTVAAAPTQQPAAGPADGATLDSFGPTLTWTNPPGTTQVQFQLIPYNGDGPGADVYLGSPVSSFWLPAPPEWYGLLPDMTYTWQVRASSSPTYAGPDHPSWGPWVKKTFRTPEVSSSTISPVSPAPGAEVQTLTPRLRWANANPNVWYYEVRLSRDPAFSNAFVYNELIHGGVSNPPNSHLVPGAFPLEQGATYYWQVRPRVQGDARRLEGYEGERRRLAVAWSEVWRFRAACIDPATGAVVSCDSAGARPIESPSTLVFVNPGPIVFIANTPGSFSLCTPAVTGPNDICPGQGLNPPGIPAADRAINPRGGNPPYHFEKAPGSQFWPFGIILHPNGLLDGTPTGRPGLYPVTIRAVDMSGAVSPQSPGAPSRVSAASDWVKITIEVRPAAEPSPTPTRTPSPTPAPEAFSSAWGCLQARLAYSDGSVGNRAYRMDVFRTVPDPSRVSVDFGVLGEGYGTLSGTQLTGTYDSPTYGTGFGTYSGTIAPDGKSGSGTLSGNWETDQGRPATRVTGTWTIYASRATRPCS